MNKRDKMALHIIGEFLIVLGSVLIDITFTQKNQEILKILWGIISVMMGAVLQWFSTNNSSPNLT